MSRALARTDTWVARSRWAMIFITAIAALLKVLATLFPDSEKHPSSWPTAAAIAAVVLIAAAAAESVWGLVRVRRRQRDSATALEVDKQLVSLLVQVSKVTGVDVDVIGCSVWSIFKQRRAAPVLHREARRRLSDYPQPSDRAWTQGKGTIGRCWERGEVCFEDWTRLQGRFKGKSEISETAWKKLKPADTYGFSRLEYLQAINKYQQVLAVPIVDGQGVVLGCVSLDIPADRPAQNSRCLDTTEVRAIAATAAATLQGLIGGRNLASSH